MCICVLIVRVLWTYAVCFQLLEQTKCMGLFYWVYVRFFSQNRRSFANVTKMCACSFYFALSAKLLLGRMFFTVICCCQYLLLFFILFLLSFIPIFHPLKQVHLKWREKSLKYGMCPGNAFRLLAQFQFVCFLVYIFVSVYLFEKISFSLPFLIFFLPLYAHTFTFLQA